ncbi:MAG: endonuclease/exonuclease/phosphatase family protein [Polyangiaceae bacterium]|nr:endonuclease/exonuclease/phosphatase family protein [Polyangiaceae bacterium]
MRELRLVTWNVWFGDWEREARWRALWERLEPLEPDIVCLQEVVPETLASRQIGALRRRGYWVSDRRLRDYDVIVAARTGVAAHERVPLPSGMGRELLVAKLAGAPPLTVATVHLESLADSTPLRVAQLERIVAHLSAEEDVVLAGDLNFPDGDRPEAALLGGFVDAWPSLHGADPGFTIDSRVNEMRYVQHGTHKQVRYDRVLLRSPRWRVADVERLGTEPLGDDPFTFVSDHFGLSVRLVADGPFGR